MKPRPSGLYCGISVINFHLRRLLAARQNMVQSRRYILFFPTWRSALIAFFFQKFFFIFLRSILSRENQIFFVTRSDGSHVLFSYGSNSFIYFPSIYSQASRLYDRSKTYLKNNRCLDEVYLCLSYPQLPWPLTWTQRERRRKKKTRTNPFD